jgi:hypothetical protein
MNELPILSTIPRSGTWFLRYAISFLCHLDRGGRIDDRLTGKVVGDPSGPRFDFEHFAGGPLFRVRGTLPAEYLFIGHTACPGFAGLGAKIDWWQRTPFHVPGYDYLHEAMNYRYTPVELASYRYTPVRVSALERATRKGRGQPIVLVYRNPIDQAASYYWYCQDHRDPAYSSSNGRPLADMPFHDYLFESALASYAKQFLSFQAMAARFPDLVRLVPYECLMARPAEVIATLLDHLAAGAPVDRHNLENAVWLARRDHMKAIENELGRSLDGTRRSRRSHIQQPHMHRNDDWIDDATCDEAIVFLHACGLDLRLFEWPAAARKPASVAA